MATIVKTTQNTWRVQVRRKDKYSSQTFRTKTEALLWARDIEYHINQGKEISTPNARHARTFSHIIDLHIADFTEVFETITRVFKIGTMQPKPFVSHYTSYLVVK